MLTVRRAALVCAAIALALAGASGTTFAQAPPTVRIATSAAETYAQAFFAQDQGLFQKAGVNAEVQVLATGAAVQTAVAGGAVDVGVGTTVGLANAAIRGVPFVMIAPAAMSTPKAPTGLICIATSSTLKAAKDFDGKTIAVPALKQTADLAVRAWLAKGGEDPARVHIIEAPFAEMGPSVARGTYEAATLSEPSLTKSVKAGLVKCPIDPFQAIAPSFTFSAWFTTREFAEKNPDAVKKVAAALTEAGKWANTHHFESAAIVSRVNKVEVDTIRAEVRPVFADEIRPAEIQPQLDAGYKFGFLTRPVTTNELLLGHCSMAVRLRAFGASLTMTALVLLGAGPSRTLRVGLTQEPATLNPIVGTLAVENDVVSFLFNGLIRFDENGNRIPDLATRVPTRANGDISADGRTITYHLVRNARWSDGVPLTSADVKFTYEQIVNPRNNVPNLDPYDRIARVETPDPYTVRLILDHPYAPAIYAFSDRNQGAIVPEHLLRGASDLNHSPFGAAPIGSGPYTLVAWRRGSEIELAANPRYFRAPPKIPHVVIRILPNDNTMTIALRAGELDLADNVNISTYLALGSVPNLDPVVVAKSFWEHLTFNTSRPPVDDVRVRRALCEAFDVHELFTKVAHGLGALGPTSENPATPWFNRKLGYLPYDPKAAGALLDEAGWRLGPDGKRSKDGTPLAITLISTAGNATREQVEVILQQRWTALGIDVTVKNLPPATIFAPIASGGIFYGGNFDVALSAFIENIPDPNRMNVNTIDHIPPHGNNLSRYRNAEITRLEEQAAGTFVDADRKRLYDRIQEIELRDLPYYVLRWQALIDERSPHLQGVKPAPSTSTFWNVADWTLR